MNGIHDIGGLTCFGPVVARPTSRCFTPFVIAVSLTEGGRFPWSEFQRRLIEAVAEAERDDPLHPSRGYYESWLVALERLLEEKGLASAAEEVRAVASASKA